MYYTTTYDSPLGEIMIAADSKGIAGLWIQGQKYFEDMGEAGATSTAEFIPGIELDKDNDIKQSLDMACRWLDRYFAGEAPGAGGTASCSGGKRVPQDGMEDTLRDTKRKNHYIRRDRKADSRYDRQEDHVCPGSRRCCGP